MKVFRFGAVKLIKREMVRVVRRKLGLGSRKSRWKMRRWRQFRRIFFMLNLFILNFVFQIQRSYYSQIGSFFSKTNFQFTRFIVNRWENSTYKSHLWTSRFIFLLRLRLTRPLWVQFYLYDGSKPAKLKCGQCCWPCACCHPKQRWLITAKKREVIRIKI